MISNVLSNSKNKKKHCTFHNPLNVIEIKRKNYLVIQSFKEVSHMCIICFCILIEGVIPLYKS